jgi:hypothetical protein
MQPVPSQILNSCFSQSSIEQKETKPGRRSRRLQACRAFYNGWSHRASVNGALQIPSTLLSHSQCNEETCEATAATFVCDDYATFVAMFRWPIRIGFGEDNIEVI